MVQVNITLHERVRMLRYVTLCYVMVGDVMICYVMCYAAVH